MPAAYSSTAFDAHTHLDDARFDPDRGDVVARAHAAGVTGFALAGADPEDWPRVLRVARSIGAVAVLGVHPWWAASLSDEALGEALTRLASMLTPHGLGETGLDRHRGTSPAGWARQQRAFRAQLELAGARDLPVVLHGAGAWAEVVRTVAARGVSSRGALAHAWTGAAEVARDAVRVGLSLSFGTDLARSRRAREAVRVVPRERLLIETDCPDRPWTSERGEPAHLIHVAREVAALRDEQLDDVLSYTQHNARRLFGVEERP